MIPYGRQTIDEDDIRAVVETLHSDWLTQGPKVAEFEKALASYCGSSHAVVFANGTVALHAAYCAAGLKDGDEILTTPLTFAATANAALWLGAKPVFADVDPLTGNLDVHRAETLITQKTRVLAPVDYAGRPVELDSFLTLARQKKLVLVEDACHALGASFKGKKVGAWADMTVFSFHPVKSITTGEGGAVLTNNASLAEKLSSFRTHGVTRRHPDWRYDIGELGYNGRLTDMQCALGTSQLKKLDSFVARRSEIADRYQRDLAGIEELALPPSAQAGGSAWHLFPIRVRTRAQGPDRSQVFASLRANGIGVQVHYIPVHRHPLYRKLGYPENLCPNAERFYEEEISLPIYPTLSEQDQKTVVRELKKALAQRTCEAKTS